jgi:hypothetical protein
MHDQYGYYTDIGCKGGGDLQSGYSRCSLGETLPLVLSTTTHQPPSYTQSGIRYPVVVRFENQNYAGVTTNNYALTEVEEAK